MIRFEVIPFLFIYLAGCLGSQGLIQCQEGEMVKIFEKCLRSDFHTGNISKMSTLCIHNKIPGICEVKCSLENVGFHICSDGQSDTEEVYLVIKDNCCYWWKLATLIIIVFSVILVCLVYRFKDRILRCCPRFFEKRDGGKGLNSKSALTEENDREPVTELPPCKSDFENDQPHAE